MRIRVPREALEMEQGKGQKKSEEVPRQGTEPHRV